MSGSAQTFPKDFVEEFLQVHKKLIAYVMQREARNLYRTYIIPRYSRFSRKNRYSKFLTSARERYCMSRRCAKSRIIEVPLEPLKSFQRILAQVLRFPIHPKATGYIQGRGILENAMCHLGAAHVLNVDFQNFYGSIRSDQLRALFIHHGLEEHVHQLLELVTYEGCLPHGAPSSPALSNSVCLELDEELEQFALKNKLSYSRYVDDVSFSSLKYIESGVLDGVRAIARRHGFTLNDGKTRFINKRKAMTVTGLVINHDPMTHQYVPRVPRKIMRRIRAMIHQNIWHGGHYAWVKGINPEQSRQIDRWRKQAAQKNKNIAKMHEEDLLL